MDKKLLCAVCVLCLCMLFASSGCSSSNLRVSVAVEGIPVTHDGYNVGPGLYLRAGQPAKVDGLNVWIDGLEPQETPQERIPNLGLIGR